MSKVKAIPDGYHTCTPYLYIRGAAAAIDFYKKAFGAAETLRIPGPEGKIGHAEIKIGNSMIMMADENLGMGAKSPQTYGGTAVSLLLYVENVDKVFNQAVASGAKVLQAVEDKFYGDRMGGLTDPFGHVWFVATHKEDVSPEEMQRRMAAAQAAK